MCGWLAPDDPNLPPEDAVRRVRASGASTAAHMAIEIPTDFPHVPTCAHAVTVGPLALGARCHRVRCRCGGCDPPDRLWTRDASCGIVLVLAGVPRPAGERERSRRHAEHARARVLRREKRASPRVPFCRLLTGHQGASPGRAGRRASGFRGG